MRHGATPLQFFSAKETITEGRYVRMLRTQILPWVRERSNNLVWQQDNAPAHKGADSMALLERQVKRWIRHWCARSPDFSAIERVWAAIQQRLDTLYLRNSVQLKEVVNFLWGYYTQPSVFKTFVGKTYENFHRSKDCGWDNKYEEA